MTVVLAPDIVTLVPVVETVVLEVIVVDELVLECVPPDAVVTAVDGASVETIALSSLVDDVLGEAEVVKKLASKVLLAPNMVIFSFNTPS